MLDFLLPLLGLFIVLGLITLLGHGIWVVLAAVGRDLFGEASQRDRQPERWSGPVPRELADLEATARQLAAFRDRGLLDNSTRDRLLGWIAARRQELLSRTPPASTPTVARPVVITSSPRLVEGTSEEVSIRAKAPPSEDIPEVIPVGVPAALETKLKRRGPLEQAVPAAAKPTMPPQSPRRSLAQVLALFMEERNILWGELVGGVLMVGCSVALVISLWQTLQQIPYFPFLILAGITTALFGAGFYTLHHWKLAATSRGLLVIATLLVPLNFVVMAGLSAGEPGGGLLRTVFRIGTEIVALAAFLGLLHRAARLLVPEGRWLLPLAVLGASVSPLLVPRVISPQQTPLGPFLLMAAWPVACCGLGLGMHLRRLTSPSPLQASQAGSLFVFLGVAAFALAAALGFLVYWGADRALALERLAVLVALVGVPVLVSGVAVQRGLEANAQQAGLRTAGTAVALAGMLVLLLAVALAWPAPAPLILVCTLNAVVLTVVAFRAELPVAHAGALPCLALGYLTVFHLLAGNLPEPSGTSLVRLAWSAETGTALVALVAALGLAAELLARVGYRSHGIVHAIGSGVMALVSVLLVTRDGLVDPGRTAVVYGLYGAGSLSLNLRWRRPLVSYLGLALLVGMTLWGLQWRTPDDPPVWALVLAVEALALAAVAVALGTPACRDTSAGVGLLALGVTGLSLALPGWHFHLYAGMALAATALLLAWAYRCGPLTWVGSALALLSLVHALVHAFPDQTVPRSALVALLAHATVSLFAHLVLPVVSRRAPSDRSDPAWSLVDRLYTQPLGQTALVSSLLAVPLLLLPARGDMAALALQAGWLAAVWLALAWAWRLPVMFAAFQVAFSVAVLYGVTAWLEGREWLAEHYPAGLVDPRSLQAYGIGLAGLGLLWGSARVALQSNAAARQLWLSEWPAVDQVVLAGLLLGQLARACWGIVPGVIQELTPAGFVPEVDAWPAVHVYAYGAGAWVLLAVLAAVLGLRFWERDPAGTGVGLVVLAITVPVLVAGRFGAELATASALRWGLALTLVANWVPLRLAAREKWGSGTFQQEATWARRLLLGCCAVPVLGLTAVVALQGMFGQLPAGPAADSVFARAGWEVCHLVPLALIGLVLGELGLRERSALAVYATGLLANLAGTILWVPWGPRTPASFAYAQVVSLAAVAALWFLLELALPPGRRGRGLPFTHAAVLIGLFALGIVVPLELAADLAGAGLREGVGLAWTALALLALVLVLCLWDREAGFTLGGLYAAGLLGVALLLHSMDLPPGDFGWSAALLLAGHLFLTCLLYWVEAPWAWLGRVGRLPERPQGWPVTWFLPVQAAVGIVVLCLSLWLSLGAAPLGRRLAGPLAVGMLVPAGVLLAGRAPALWKAALRSVALGLGVVVVVELGWAFLGPIGPGLWLNRSILLLAALTVPALAYGLGLPRILSRFPAWADGARQAGPVLGVLASSLVLVVLVQELLLYDFVTRRTPMLWPAVLTVAGALLGLMTAAICFAVVPGRDPFGLSERGRRLYVYAAEVGLAVLFVHVRLNVPELFGGWLARHWALLIMAIVYVGAGVGEFFRRRDLPVLAGPLVRTGIFLPLLPLLVFWARPPAAMHAFAGQWLPGLRPLLESLDRLPRNFDYHSLLWFLLGLLYALVAASQRSFRWALLAALAANLGLWALLTHLHVHFWLHPQVWLIPTALIVLTAEHLNRDRLTPYQGAMLRYVGLMLLYVSSTADMFLTGLGNSVLLPVVLAVLSVGGILLGIGLQVRAFLFLGFTFLCLVVFSMIWHAAVDHYQTWVWWASGIVLGAGILTLFAVFEKRRQDVVQLIDEIRKWD